MQKRKFGTKAVAILTSVILMFSGISFGSMSVPDAYADDGDGMSYQEPVDYLKDNIDTSLTGDVETENSDIISKALGKTESVQQDEQQYVFVKYTLANAAKLNGNTKISDVYDNAPDAVMGQFTDYVVPYVANDDSDYMIVDLSGITATGAGKLIDATSVHNVENDLSGYNPEIMTDVVYDLDKGLAYIPRGYFYNQDGSSRGFNMTLQVMVASDISSDQNEDANDTGVDVEIENSSAATATMKQGTVRASMYDVATNIQLVTQDTAGMIDASKIHVYINGTEKSEDVADASIMDDTNIESSNDSDDVPVDDDDYDDTTREEALNNSHDASDSDNTANAETQEDDESDSSDEYDMIQYDRSTGELAIPVSPMLLKNVRVTIDGNPISNFISANTNKADATLFKKTSNEKLADSMRYLKDTDGKRIYFDYLDAAAQKKIDAGDIFKISTKIYTISKKSSGWKGEAMNNTKKYLFTFTTGSSATDMHRSIDGKKWGNIDFYWRNGDYLYGYTPAQGGFTNTADGSWASKNSGNYEVNFLFALPKEMKQISGGKGTFDFRMKRTTDDKGDNYQQRHALAAVCSHSSSKLKKNVNDGDATVRMTILKNDQKDHYMIVGLVSTDEVAGQNAAAVYKIGLPSKGGFEITKKDVDGKKVDFSGVKFGVYAKFKNGKVAGDQVDSFKIDDDNEGGISDIAAGTYYLKELSIPKRLQKKPYYYKTVSDGIFKVVVKVGATTKKISVYNASKKKWVKGSSNGKVLQGDNSVVNIPYPPGPNDPEMETTASTETQVLPVGSDAVISDKVSLTHLRVDNIDGEKKYKLVGELHYLNDDGSEGDKVTDASGNAITAESDEFLPTQNSEGEGGYKYGDIDVTLNFTVPYDKAVGKNIVVYEKMYNVIKDPEMIRPELSEMEIDNEKQTVSFYDGPEIHTNATDGISGTHNGILSNDTTKINDEVSYENLDTTKKYTIIGTLMDKETGEKFLDENGNPITKTLENFTPESSDGEVTITFEIKSELLRGKTVVVFEGLYLDNKEVTVHNDINDTGQTVTYPNITTQAIDRTTSTHEGMASEKTNIDDIVTYSNLATRQKYILKGTLYDKQTGSALVDENGNNFIAIVNFTAGVADSEEQVTETSDTEEEEEEQETNGNSNENGDSSEKSNNADGDNEESGDNGDSTQENENDPDEEDAEDQDGNDAPNDDEKELDANSLVPETTVSGANGEYASGGVTVQFPSVPKSVIEGKTIVVYEELYLANDDVANESSSSETEENEKVKVNNDDEASEQINGTLVVKHGDIDDVAQTVYYPKVRTKAGVDGKNTVDVGDQITLTDIVSYWNLETNVTYRLEGQLIDKQTGKPVDGVKTDTVDFTPSTIDGAQEVKFTFDASSLGDHDTVVFEKLYKVNAGLHGETVQVGEHADINDADQTVHFTNPAPPASGVNDESISQTGDNAPVILFVAIGIAALAAICIVRRAKRKE